MTRKNNNSHSSTIRWITLIAASTKLGKWLDATATTYEAENGSRFIRHGVHIHQLQGWYGISSGAFSSSTQQKLVAFRSTAAKHKIAACCDSNPDDLFLFSQPPLSLSPQSDSSQSLQRNHLFLWTLLYIQQHSSLNTVLLSTLSNPSRTSNANTNATEPRQWMFILYLKQHTWLSVRRFKLVKPSAIMARTLVARASQRWIRLYWA